MKHNYLLLITAIIFGILLLSSGCQEDAKALTETKSELISPAPNEPSKPEPVKPKEPPKTEAIKVKPDVNGPRILFEDTVYDFGKIGPETRNVCEFKFKNVGNELLRITKVSKTCGCTPFALKKKEFAPGESGTLEVRYNASAGAAKVKKTLYMSSNDKTNPKVKLTIKAEIVTKIDYKPKVLTLLLNKENAGCKNIEIFSLDDKKFSIKSFRSTSDCITLDFDPSVSAKKFTFKPKVNIEKLRKRLRGTIKIDLTHPEAKAISIRFSAKPEFKLNPQTLTLFNCEPNKPITREVWILSNYDEDFEIEATSFKKGFMKVLEQEKLGKRYKFVLEITPPALSKDAPAIFTDIFYMNIKNGDKLAIVCRGYYSKKAKDQSSRQGQMALMVRAQK